MIRGILADASIDLREILSWLNRDELKEICEALNLDASGRDKEGYVVRIVAHVAATVAPRAAVAAPEEDASETPVVPPNKSSRRQRTAESDEVDVFIVHGHDDRMRLEIKRFVETLRLKAVVLQDAPDRGMTILEKLEHYVQKAKFAVILLSPDDDGYSKRDGEKALQSRARQNVILELGMMIGSLGRSNVAVLASGALEKPSDIDGLVYIEYDPRHADASFLRLARQLRTAGFSIDMNLVT